MFWSCNMFPNFINSRITDFASGAIILLWFVSTELSNVNVWAYTGSEDWPNVSLKGARSVESPSLVDPQWNILYWGSKWNLHTVCWGEVDCERGTTSVYFGITYVCFIPSRLHVFAVEPQYQHRYFLFSNKKHIFWNFLMAKPLKK